MQCLSARDLRVGVHGDGVRPLCERRLPAVRPCDHVPPLRRWILPGGRRELHLPGLSRRQHTAGRRGDGLLAVRARHVPALGRLDRLRRMPVWNDERRRGKGLAFRVRVVRRRDIRSPSRDERLPGMCPGDVQGARRRHQLPPLQAGALRVAAWEQRVRAVPSRYVRRRGRRGGREEMPRVSVRDVWIYRWSERCHSMHPLHRWHFLDGRGAVFRPLRGVSRWNILWPRKPGMRALRRASLLSCRVGLCHSLRGTRTGLQSNAPGRAAWILARVSEPWVRWSIALPARHALCTE